MKLGLVTTLALLAACPAHAERIPSGGEWPEAKELRLQIGKLTIIDGNRAEEAGAASLLLDKRKLFEIDDYLWTFVGKHKPQDRWMLVEAIGGGSDCAAMWRVLDLTDPAAPKISPEFGNCSDFAPIEITRTPEALRIALRNTDETAKRKQDVFLYRDGAIYTLRGKREVPIGPSRATRKEADDHPIDPALLQDP
jgi:hypothetical protein